MVDEQQDGKQDQPTVAPGGPKRRVLCTSSNPSSCIDGVVFAKVKLGNNEPVCISEHVADDAKYKHFLAVPGFEPYTNASKADNADIEKALEVVRREPSTGSIGSAVADYQRQLREAQAANRNIAGKHKEVVEENVRLKTRIAELESKQVQASTVRTV